MATVESLFIYPLKSAGPLALESMEIGDTGPLWDRQWMLIDEDDDFISQRKHPKMCLIDQQIENDTLVLNTPEMGELRIPLHFEPSKKLASSLLGNTVDVLPMGDPYDQWFQDFLEAKVRLVRSPIHTQRTTSGRHGPRKAPVGLADGYPFLLTSKSTLKELNQKMSDPILMNRFRPNIVIEGGEANQEDQWKKFSISGVPFHSVKACRRCAIITVEQESGLKNNETMRVLGSYRKLDGKVVFGQNLIHDKKGTIKVGDSIEELVLKDGD